MLTEFQTKNKTQCPKCNTWRNKVITICNSKECQGTVLKRMKKKEKEKKLDKVILLYKKGIPNKEISKVTGIARTTIIRWIRGVHF